MLKKGQSPFRWEFYAPRREWICECGVGHYDPRLVKDTIHGCCGCCSRTDFPGRVSEESNEQ